jgi:hypothetical protein
VTDHLPTGAPRLRLRRVPLGEVVEVQADTCPQCEGDWLYDLLFRHAPTCPLRAAEDATAEADYRHRPRPFLRPATATELLLATALGVPEEAIDEGRVTVHYITTAVRRRVNLGGFDLDRLCTAEEIVAAGPGAAAEEEASA